MKVHVQCAILSLGVEPMKVHVQCAARQGNLNPILANSSDRFLLYIFAGMTKLRFDWLPLVRDKMRVCLLLALKLRLPFDYTD